MNETLEKRWQRRQKGLEKSRQFGIDKFLQAAMTTREGRDYVWWLLEISTLNHNPHTANALNTAFNCGQMNVGQQVLAHLMSVAPEGYFNMLKEREEEKKDAERTRAELERTDADTEPGNSRDDTPRSDGEYTV